MADFERLTERMSDGTAYVRSETGTEGVGSITTQRRLPDVISRLAAYEDSGLTPERADEFGKAIANGARWNLCDTCAKEFYECNAEQITFGNGKCNDNVIACDAWMPHC